MLGNVEDLNDVRMLQPRDGLGLGKKPLSPFEPSMVAVQNHLQRDNTIEAQMPRLVDDAHTPTAELAHDLVARNAHIRLPAAPRWCRNERRILEMLCVEIAVRRAGGSMGRNIGRGKAILRRRRFSIHRHRQRRQRIVHRPRVRDRHSRRLVLIGDGQGLILRQGNSSRGQAVIRDRRQRQLGYKRRSVVLQVALVARHNQIGGRKVFVLR